MALSTLQRETLFRRLGLLLQGGLPLLSALEALGRQGSGETGRVCSLLAAQLRRGSSLSQALHRQRTQVGDLAWVLAEGGELSGQLPAVFQQLAVFYQKKRENQKALLQASLYPALVLGITGLLGLYFLWSILPLFGDLYASLHLPMSPGLRFFLSLSRLLHGRPWLLPVGLLAAAFLLRLAWQRRSRWLLRCPGLTSLNRKFWEIRYLGLLSLLLRGGLALETASRLSRQVVAGRPFSHCAREGDRLFSPLTVEFLALGEESGNLSGLLMEAACILEQDFQSRLKQLKTLLEPALLLTLALGCGGMLLFLLTPLFELMNGISFL
ncbi:type II secretion system F family protein [Acidaminococcus timonensis]|uniref:type II secretion system F family protein n=1 Tax=Acidaminococcus timonensis TaxID=1871002 RepID=UPI0008D9B5A9|nr:type II secretion system F family protein [Acidaminococcus timonensis]